MGHILAEKTSLARSDDVYAISDYWSKFFTDPKLENI
jgi:hypothetical protein